MRTSLTTPQLSEGAALLFMVPELMGSSVPAELFSSQWLTALECRKSLDELDEEADEVPVDEEDDDEDEDEDDEEEDDFNEDFEDDDEDEDEDDDEEEDEEEEEA